MAQQQNRGGQGGNRPGGPGGNRGGQGGGGRDGRGRGRRNDGRDNAANQSNLIEKLVAINRVA